MAAHRKLKNIYIPYFIMKLYKNRKDNNFIISPSLIKNDFDVDKSNRSRLLKEFYNAGVLKAGDKPGEYKICDELKNIDNTAEFFEVVLKKLQVTKNGRYKILINVIKIISLLKDQIIKSQNITENLIKYTASKLKIKNIDTVVDYVQTYIANIKKTNTNNDIFDLVFSTRFITANFDNLFDSRDDNILELLVLIKFLLEDDFIGLEFKKTSPISFFPDKERTDMFYHLLEYLEKNLIFLSVNNKITEENEVDFIIGMIYSLLTCDLRNIENSIVLFDDIDLSKKINYFKTDSQLAESLAFSSMENSECKEIILALTDAIHLAKILKSNDESEMLYEYLAFSIMLLYYIKSFKFRLIRILLKYNKLDINKDEFLKNHQNEIMLISFLSALLILDRLIKNFEMAKGNINLTMNIINFMSKLKLINKNDSYFSNIRIWKMKMGRLSKKVYDLIYVKLSESEIFLRIKDEYMKYLFSVKNNEIEMPSLRLLYPDNVSWFYKKLEEFSHENIE